MDSKNIKKSSLAEWVECRSAVRQLHATLDRVERQLDPMAGLDAEAEKLDALKSMFGIKS